jgi:hypothetical protein
MLDESAKTPHRKPPRRGWGVLVACGALAATLALWLGGVPLMASGHAVASRAYMLPALFRPPDSDVNVETSSGLHQYWQVGLSAGPEASNASGMRTTISTRLPQRVADRTTNYYWIGSYLADGSFVQVGYYVPWYDQAAAGWFYCAFTSSQQKGPCVYGPAGSAGSNATTHSYALEMNGAHGATRNAVVWTALVDGAPVGSFPWTSGTTGQNTPGIFAESSGFEDHAAQSTLGPVDFTQPIETRTVGQTGYRSASHVRPQYDADDVCPPYGVASDGTGGALLGSALACPAASEWLW